ncbi:dihydromonapterin reductase [Marinomonas posidonica]|uniref:Dihydromonapterin reductase n=1 Tax=Marinomonas posidonica (strain CECT 7376 / NCIMB 14433 / IVIA-Po-181) TaxID=491952 RepID=F6CTE7_MARPP|nr:dihydromonapterin reductase [Marinomonas posidonica]AEF53996.1 Dihydrofolate reductase [Marinomonas posidonica IVIA-Po-181]
MMRKSPIIITGGGQRLGLACAQALHEQGYKVIITYRRHREEINAIEASGIQCLQADFSTQNGVEAFIKKVLEDYDALGAIIHNASEWEAEKNCSDTKLLMEKMWQVHVFAPYRINLAFEGLLCAGFKDDGVADIIHMTDYVVEKGSDKHIAYAASKAGLANLTCSFAKRYSPCIKVNAIAPSLLMFHNSDNDDYRQKALNKSLLQKEPGEQEGVLAVKYVLESGYLTGRTLSLDGGRHLV